MPKLIYIAEDEAVNGELLKNKLKMQGYTAELAFNGLEVINLIRYKKPDLLLLDILMPDMNGYEVLGELRKDEAVRDLKVIILTNLMLPEDKEKAVKLGVLDYIIKSDSSLADIVKKVDYYLQ